MRASPLRWLFRILLALAVTAAAALAYAPYLPRLLAEGYPRPEWPARGSFAAIKGAPASGRLGEALQTTLSPGLAKLFAESDGKALLVYQSGQLQLGVTPRDLLYMKSGIVFETDEMKHMSGSPEKDLETTISNPFGPMARLHVSGLAGLEASLHNDPGKRGSFSYQNITTALLGSLLAPIDSRLSAEIWRPAGAQGAQWRRYGEDLDVSAYCYLYARARDWVEVARYIVNNGTPGNALLSDGIHRTLLGQGLSDDEFHQGVYGLHAWHDILDRQENRSRGASPISWAMAARPSISCPRRI